MFLARLARGFALLLTLAIKVVGLASAVNQLLLHASPSPVPLAVSAFMMAGAQLSEGLVLAMIDRFLPGREERERAQGPNGRRS